jgi:hypothetical protein
MQATVMNEEKTNRAGQVAAAMVLALLAACGGGSDDDDGGGSNPPPGNPPPTEPVPTSGIPALVGDWVQKRCTQLGTSSARTLARFTQTGDATVTYGSGLVQYASANCTGAGTVLPATTIGSIQITGVKTAPGIAAHWGRQSLITGIVSYTVLSKLSDNELCMIGDQNPTLFADAASVLQSINVSRDASCYDKR